MVHVGGVAGVDSGHSTSMGVVGKSQEEEDTDLRRMRLREDFEHLIIHIFQKPNLRTHRRGTPTGQVVQKAGAYRHLDPAHFGASRLGTTHKIRSTVRFVFWVVPTVPASFESGCAAVCFIGARLGPEAPPTAMADSCITAGRSPASFFTG
ncbi:hypothetical protein MTO96_027255 [Rhipicephalus appendiculatus]